MTWQDRLTERESDTHFVVEGRLAVERLQASNYEIEKVIQIGMDLTRDEASQLLGFQFHRGILAIARKPTRPELSDFGPGTIVILPEIADPGNLGTIIRNTAALGGSGVLVGKGASPFNAKAVRASAGTLFQLPLRKSPDLQADLVALAKTHTLVGASLSEGSLPLANLPPLDRPPALLLGPEDFGLNPEIEALCHHLAYLPMSRSVDSLNVASASAIFLNELR
ncbi:RNA methyltransferase [Verrucomicrobiaceae bacterium 227]